jgi:hypothetical protein
MVLERIEAGAAFEHPEIHLSENSIQMLHLTRK